MFNIANKISLWTAGLGSSLKNIIGAESASNQLSAPASSSLFAGLFGGMSWADIGLTFISAIAELFYMIIRFCLNIVDFLQFFVKHLIGIDYWEKGDVSIDTLGDSDIIFKFLYNSTVQRVFKYMLGLFVVLLILFAIIAIVKSEYQVAMETDKAEVNALKVLKNCGKAILMVVLVPVLLVMGILASNAVLAGLVNTLNVNNHLTLGGQVFTASAYDANRYRKYAQNGVRYAVSNDINVTLDGTTYSIKSSMTPVIPRDFTKSNPFTGFAFKFKEAYYLYYVSEDELLKVCGEHSVYDYYVEYFTNILGVELLDYETFNTENMGTGREKYIRTRLNNKGKNSAIIKAAYNTWNYNSILNNNKTTFEKSLSYELYSKVYGESYTTDSGNTYADAKVYRNSDAWAAIHDGGKYGLVALPDEYYVMADMVDFVVSDVAEVAYVNALNPLIDWEYSNDPAGYLSSKFVQYNKNSAGTEITGIKSFVVNYKDSGMVVYQPKNQSRESLGAVYIMAYYSAASNRYIPIVNGKSFTDDYGTAHKFTSEYLDSNYNGLIVARGILEQTAWKNIYGYPTEISAEFDKGLNGESVNTETEYYYTSSVQEKRLLTNTIMDISASFNTSLSPYLDTSTGNNFASLIPTEVVDITTAEGKNILKNSLIKSFTYRTLVYDGYDTDAETGTVTPKYVNGERSVSNIEWTLSGDPITVTKAGEDKTIYVYASNKTIYARIDNANFTDDYTGTNPNVDNVNKNYNLPLYAFVEIITNADGTHSINVKYVYAQYKYADQAFFQKVNSSATINEESTSKNIYTTTYSFNIGGHGQYQGNGIVAKSLNIRDNLTLGTTADDVSCYIVNSSLSYDNERRTFSSTTGKVLTNDVIQTEERYGDIVYSDVLKLCKEIDGNFISGDVNIAFGNGANSNSGGSTLSVSGVFREISGARVTSGDLTIYQFGLYDTSTGQFVQVPYKYTKIVDLSGITISRSTPIIVTLYYNSKDQTVGIYANDLMTLILGGRILSISDDPYITSLYDMVKYDEEIVDSTSTVYKYRYKINNQYYYTDYNYTISNGIISLTNKATTLYEVVVNTYNMFTYTKTGSSTLQQYDPVTGDSGTVEQPLSQTTAYVRKSSLKLTRQAMRDGEYIYLGNIYLENNDDSATANGTLFASFYVSVPYNIDEEGNPIVPTVSVEDAITNSYRFIVGNSDFQKVPVYTNEDIETELKASSATIYFKRQYVSGGQTFIDYDIGFLNDKSSRLKIALFSGTSDTKYNTSSFRIVGARFKFDYNFVSTTALGLSIKTFYLPAHLNVVILVFAAGLLISILGKAVWGLIQRIFDITLYFIILPGVTSTYPLDDGKKFGTWKDTVVKKVLGAYGVMLGLNIFFILCPAIKSISHLFTAEDMNQLSSGNILAGLSPNFINSICEIMFMLVALTMIQTLPKLISGLVGGEDALSTAKDTKENIGKMTKEAGSTITGAKALDAVFGKYDDKAGKRKGGIGGQLKNFVPGSAVYDDIKRKIDQAKKESSKSSEEVANDAAKRAAAAAAAAAAQASSELTKAADASAENFETPAEDKNKNTIDNDNANINTGETNDANENNEAITEEKKTEETVKTENDGQSDEDGKGVIPSILDEFKGGDRKTIEGLKEAIGENQTLETARDGFASFASMFSKNKRTATETGKQLQFMSLMEKLKAEATDENGKFDQSKYEGLITDNIEQITGLIGKSSAKNFQSIENRYSGLKKKEDEIKASNAAANEFIGNQDNITRNEQARTFAENYKKMSKKYGQDLVDNAISMEENKPSGSGNDAKPEGETSKEQKSGDAKPTSDKPDTGKKDEPQKDPADDAKDQFKKEDQTTVDDLRKAIDDLKKNGGGNKTAEQVKKEFEDFVSEYRRSKTEATTTDKQLEFLRLYGEMVGKATKNGVVDHKALEEMIVNGNNGKNIEIITGLIGKKSAKTFESIHSRYETLSKKKSEIEAKNTAAKEFIGNEDNKQKLATAKQFISGYEDLTKKYGAGLTSASLNVNSAKTAQTAETAKTAQNVNESTNKPQGGNSGADNAERARLYAESAQKAAEASRIYSDIASGNVAQYAERAKEEKHKKTALEKDYEKLAKLVEERDKRLEDQENGHADLGTTMGPVGRALAYAAYNKGKSESESIIDSLKVSDEKKEELKKKKSLELYNKAHGTSLTELTEAQQKQADELLKKDQDVMKAIARKEYKDDKLDKSIAKVQERIALREAGVYVNPVAKIARNVGSFLIGNREMTEKQRQKFAAKAAEAEKKGTALYAELEGLDEKITKEKEDLIKEKGLVFGKDGKIDRRATLLARYKKADKENPNGLFKGINAMDEEGIQKDLEASKAEFDSLDSRLEAMENGTYKEQLSKPIQRELAKQRGKFDRYTAQMNNERFGWSHSFAARFASGKRAVRARLDKAGISKSERKVESATAKFEKKATLVAREAHGGRKFTNKQAKELDELKSSLGASEAELRTIMRGEGFKGNVDRQGILEFGKQLQGRISAETDAKKKQALQELYGRYRKAASEYQPAKLEYERKLSKFSVENEQTFLGRGDLRKHRIKAAEAKKAQLARELAEAKKSGRLTATQEDDYITRISNYEKQIADINSSYQKYRKPRKSISISTKLKKVFTPVTAVMPASEAGTYSETSKILGSGKVKAGKRAKPIKITHRDMARSMLATEAYVGARRSQIRRREDETSTRAAEKISDIRTKQAETASRLTANAQQDYVEKVIKALSKSGNASLIKQITSATTPEAAAIAAKKASEQAIQSLEARKKEIQKEMRANPYSTRAEDLKAQEKVVSATLKKLRTAANSEQVAAQMAKSSAMKSQSETAVAAAIRSAYKEQWNKFASRNGLRASAKSGSAAYEANKSLRRELTAENARLQKQIAELRRNTPTSRDISRLTSMIDANNQKLNELVAMNKDAENRAKKALKKATSMESIMKDMRRASKYKIPGVNKPKGSN